MFYGSKNSRLKVFNRTLPNDVLEELITLGKETTRQHDTKTDDRLVTTSRSTVRSNRLLEPGLKVITADGDRCPYDSLPPSTPILCPVHVDNNPSAYTTKSLTGAMGIHCSKCECTYWPTNDFPGYDFNYDLSNLNTFVPDEEDISGVITMEIPAIQRMEQQYLNCPSSDKWNR